MKRFLPVFLLVCTCLVSGCQAQDLSLPTTLPPIQVYFSPKGGCTEAVVRELDAAKAITGSFNVTTNAEEHNAENLLVIRSPELAKTYTANWQAHAEHSEPYAGREQGNSQTHRAEPAAPAPTATDGEAGFDAVTDQLLQFIRKQTGVADGDWRR